MFWPVYRIVEQTITQAISQYMFGPDGDASTTVSSVEEMTRDSLENESKSIHFLILHIAFVLMEPFSFDTEDDLKICHKYYYMH